MHKQLEVPLPGEEVAYNGNPNARISIDARGDVVTEIREDARYMLYTMQNESLQFTSNGVDVQFHLSRTKVAFDLWFEPVDGTFDCQVLGGELIDVSIVWAHDAHSEEHLRHFFEHARETRAMFTFPSPTPGTPDLRMWGFSLVSMLEDLEFILFDVVEYPWLDNKYKKRLRRLFLLTFVEYYTREHDLSKKQHALINLRQYLQNKLDDIGFGREGGNRREQTQDQFLMHRLPDS